MGQEPGKGPSDMEKMIKGAKAWMPQLFKLLDSDSSGAPRGPLGMFEGPADTAHMMGAVVISVSF